MYALSEPLNQPTTLRVVARSRAARSLLLPASGHREPRSLPVGAPLCEALVNFFSTLVVCRCAVVLALPPRVVVV